jgi:uncharacterized protein (DUF2249 family)
LFAAGADTVDNGGRERGLLLPLLGPVTVSGGRGLSVQGPRLVVDIRALTPALRRPLVLAVIDHLLNVGSTETIVVITDHEPVGLGYQMELRRETRGRVGFSYDQRLDGAWVALITLKPSA